MGEREATPGVSRDERLSDEGLKRLDAQLSSGSTMSDLVLRQWIVRYGDGARVIISRHGRYHAELEQPKE